MTSPLDWLRSSSTNAWSAFVASLEAYSALHWGSSLEPSHALVNKFTQMHEDNILKYIPWEQLTSRSHEAQGLQKDVGTRLIVTDSSGSLRFRTMDN
eukprot:4488500-Amphidinium_carterae.1